MVRTTILRSLVVLFLVSSPLRSGAEPLREIRSTPPGPTVRVIVEFSGAPAVRSDTASVSAHQELFERFRSDLAGPMAGKGRTTNVPVIHHEFRTTILGAAVEASPATVERLRKLPYVSRISPDVTVTATDTVPVEPFDGPVDAREQVNAIPLATGGAGVVVAVIDTGIDYRHPALGGGFGPGFKVVGGWDFVNEDDDPIDDEGHGTHVAGTIAANATGLLGVAPDATLLAYKVLDRSGNGRASDIIAGIERSVDPNQDGDFSDRADVLNLSLGGPGDAEDPISRAVDAAVAAGSVVVVAAGNSGGSATISSPGTAVDAITVAAVDSNFNVTSFSSRGPSPRLLGFKPDVSAPGDEIPSTKMGGGLLTLSGTSMAAPHVAGVAALLIDLHPDWEPSRIKEAITSTAVKVEDHPFARGAGRVDALAAHQTTLSRNRSGLSFGLRASRTGISTESRVIRLTNHGPATQTLTVAPGSLPAGIAISIVPVSVRIGPGGYADVTVEMTASHELLEYPHNSIIGGDLLITGTSTMTVPWALLRTARATVEYEGLGSLLLMIDSDGGRHASIRIGQRAEFFLPPNRTWDLLIESYDIPEEEGAAPDVKRLILREDVVVDGDVSLRVAASEASLELDFDGRDQHDQPLASRTLADERHFHLLGVRIMRQVDGSEFSLSMLEKRAMLKRMLFSPFPDRFRFYLYEQRFDPSTGEAYSIEHEHLEGLQESRTLRRGGSELMRAGIRWKRPPFQTDALQVCSVGGQTTRISTLLASCFEARVPESAGIDLYITEEQSPMAFSGMMFGTGDSLTQALRGRNGEIVASSERSPGPSAYRIQPGGDYRIGAGPAFPFAFPGTTAGVWYGLPWPGFYGAGGETIRERDGSRWTVFDRDGNVTARGRWRQGWFGPDQPPPPQAGHRIVVERDGIEGFGRFGRGVLEVTFGNDPQDLTAPTLTSLRIVDSLGELVAGVEPGAAASLQFSIADADMSKAGQTKPSRPEMTRVFARVRGANEWHPIPTLVAGNESGSTTSLHHFPAGDLYIADLTSMTGQNDRWIDIRVDFEDAAGNKSSWSSEMALAVGDPVQPRRRSVR